MSEEVKLLPRRSLRAMRDRWQADYDRLEAVGGDWSNDSDDGDAAYSYVETMRNLATAIAHIDGMIVVHRKGDRP